MKDKQILIDYDEYLELERRAELWNQILICTKNPKFKNIFLKEGELYVFIDGYTDSFKINNYAKTQIAKQFLEKKEEAHENNQQHKQNGIRY